MPTQLQQLREEQMKISENIYNYVCSVLQLGKHVRACGLVLEKSMSCECDMAKKMIKEFISKEVSRSSLKEYGEAVIKTIEGMPVEKREGLYLKPEYDKSKCADEGYKLACRLITSLIKESLE